LENSPQVLRKFATDGEFNAAIRQQVVNQIKTVKRMKFEAEGGMNLMRQVPARVAKAAKAAKAANAVKAAP